MTPTAGGGLSAYEGRDRRKRQEEGRKEWRKKERKRGRQD